MGNLLIGNILDYSIKIGASDIHITEGKPLIFRVEGKLINKDDSGIIDSEKINIILKELLENNEENYNNFLKNRDLDFAYIYKDEVSFRINAFYKLDKIGFVMRMIKNEAKTMKELGMPPAVSLFTKFKQGLVLITGPTGSGKSTSMVSILETINNERGEHILTIEDPIEYVFKDKKSIFSQREVGNDTESFHTALKAAMREDPNIIMVGELRDPETVNAALDLAETGHLVISTLHTSSAVKTIDRLLSFFPIEGQPLVREKLSESLRGVLSQRLIPKVGGGRVAIFELMFVNTGIRNLIRTGVINQIQGYIETGSKAGMIHMKKFADYMRDKGIILEKDYDNYFKVDDSDGK